MVITPDIHAKSDVQQPEDPLLLCRDMDLSHCSPYPPAILFRDSISLVPAITDSLSNMLFAAIGLGSLVSHFFRQIRKRETDQHYNQSMLLACIVAVVIWLGLPIFCLFPFLMPIRITLNSSENQFPGEPASVFYIME